ncbi:hypothetical protein [Blastococcus capsensis]|uniref:hypothetical protein n=1 Tax=Blastococcus capsensis TaxID=1564163 RepID=UPI0025401979|nr:hypothetical protein [Blastococcus capsensis]MDK3257108.1 hypothetical protein [Blastococcus capsensis]
MSAVWVVAAVWMGLALVFGLLLSGAIRLADAKESRTSGRLNFVVDGDPFDAPLPAAPVFATARAPLAGTIPFTRRPVDGG